MTADRVERAAGTARTLAAPRGQSGTVNSASRGRGLTGKPVTESNLSLRAPAQIPAVRYAADDNCPAGLLSHVPLRGMEPRIPRRARLSAREGQPHPMPTKGY